MHAPAPGRPAAILALALLLVASGCALPPRPTARRSAALPRPDIVGVADLEYLRSRRLMVPVEGVAPRDVPDTFHARRGARRHGALDILAPRGTPVLATDSGRILKIRENSAGGLTIYAVEPSERFVFYYAHLDRYAKGLREGAAVRQGDVIGYVGTTGNAPRNVPHLHFQLMRLRDVSRWWDGTPIDPRPLLVVRGARR